jgi:hypothetical protein
MSKDKRFIVRKYVMAPTAEAAIERERTQPVDEVYLDAPPSESKGSVYAIGFRTPVEAGWRDDEALRRQR